MRPEMLAGRGPQFARIVITGFIWCMLTVALGAVVIYANPSLEGIVAPHVSTSYMLVGAFLIAGILGTVIRSPVLLLVLTGLMCLGGACFFAVVVLAPTRTDAIESTVELENYASLRVLLFTVMMIVPAIFGALAGIVVGGRMDKNSQ